MEDSVDCHFHLVAEFEDVFFPWFYYFLLFPCNITFKSEGLIIYKFYHF